MNNYPDSLTAAQHAAYFAGYDQPEAHCDDCGTTAEQDVTPCCERETCDSLLCDVCWRASQDGECKQCRGEAQAREDAAADAVAEQVERETEARVRL